MKNKKVAVILLVVKENLRMGIILNIPFFNAPKTISQRIHGTGIFYLHLPNKSTIHVGKYTNPMDPTGIGDDGFCHGKPQIFHASS